MHALRDKVNALWDTYASYGGYDGRLSPESVIAAQLNMPKRKVIDARRGYVRVRERSAGITAYSVLDRSYGRGFCSTQCKHADVSLSAVSLCTLALDNTPTCNPR